VGWKEVEGAISGQVPESFSPPLCKFALRKMKRRRKRKRQKQGCIAPLYS
jgi:hypothetical protein